MTIGAAERVGPNSDVGILAEHRCRYRFAAKMTAPASSRYSVRFGLGFLYFPEAALVVGVDVDVDALRLADDVVPVPRTRSRFHEQTRPRQPFRRDRSM